MLTGEGKGEILRGLTVRSNNDLKGDGYNNREYDQHTDKHDGVRCSLGSLPR